MECGGCRRGAGSAPAQCRRGGCWRDASAVSARNVCPTQPFSALPSSPPRLLPRMAPAWLQVCPKLGRECLGCCRPFPLEPRARVVLIAPQDEPKKAPRDPKMATRTPKMAPKRPENGPKKALRRPQGGSKMAPRWPQVAPRWPQLKFGSAFGSSLVSFSEFLRLQGRPPR